MAMNMKKRIYRKLRNIGRNLRSALFPTDTEQKRKWRQEEQKQERYEKYIPNFMTTTYTTTVSYFFLGMFIYFMMFGISVTERTEKVNTESRREYKRVLAETKDIEAANLAVVEYTHKHPVTNDVQMKMVWDRVMTPLGLNKNTYLNWLILLEGTIIGLAPTLVLAHRKSVIDKMHAEKWKLMGPIDKIDTQIIQSMSKDSPNYFYHLTMSLTGPEKLTKYKKIAIPIIRGYMESNPQDKKAAAILKAFIGKIK